MVDRFGDVAAIRDALLARDDLPAATRQNLVTRLSQTLAGFVVDRAWLEEDRARRIARKACEKATVTIAAGSAKPNCGRSFAISARAVSSPPAWSCAHCYPATSLCSKKH